MSIEKINTESDFGNWICPDIRPGWKLVKVRGAEAVLLKAIEGEREFRFTEAQGYALQHFTGVLTVVEVQSRLSAEFSRCDRNLVAKLVQKLIALGILARVNGHRLKAIAQWLEHPNGSWILRNPVEMTFLQVSREDKVIIECLGVSQDETAEFTASAEKLYSLLELLAATAMLEPDVGSS
jgi:putative peptide zinc metalloprotease protein